MPLNEKQITELSEKYGMHKWQIEDMIKISDFTDKRDFTDDGTRMNGALLQELVESFEAMGLNEDPAVNQRVDRMYNELKNYLLKQLKKKKKKSDFTDDGRVSWQIRPEDERWVHRMANKMRDLGDALDKNGVSFWHRMRYENTMKDVLKRLNDIYDRGKK